MYVCVTAGHAEWEDADERAQLLLMAQRPSEIATQLYQKVRETGMIGSVYTVLELYEGDEAAVLGTYVRSSGLAVARAQLPFARAAPESFTPAIAPFARVRASLPAAFPAPRPSASCRVQRDGPGAIPQGTRCARKPRQGARLQRRRVGCGWNQILLKTAPQAARGRR